MYYSIPSTWPQEYYIHLIEFCINLLQVSTFEMDEETALMDDKSEEEESGDVSGSDIDKRSKGNGEESDEELINL